jgi:hypothetical protein
VNTVAIASPADMKAALTRSGYLLEARVEQVLEKRGYYVQASLEYPDPEEGKLRELDLHALSATILEDSDAVHVVFSSLLIECSNNLQPLALLPKATRPPLLAEAVPILGTPTTIGGTPLHERIGLARFHHCCREPIATQFCSFQQKKTAPHDWMAAHDDGQWASIKKLRDALQHDANEIRDSWVPPTRTRPEAINLSLHYCVLVLQGELVEVDARQPMPEPKAAARGLLYRATHDHQRPFASFVDVVTEAALPQYVDVVEKERRLAAKAIKASLDEFKSAASREARSRRRTVARP